MTEQTLNLLNKQYLLLDTNILIDATEHIVAYKNFFDALNGAEVSAILDPVVNIEFLRGVKKSHIPLMREFLSKLFGRDPMVLVVGDETFKTAQNIARICHLTDNKKIALGDCLIAAQIAKYGGERKHGRLYLATQNHKDFPPCLFDRLDVQIITTRDGSIKTIGIYQFDEANYRKLVAECL